MAQYGLETETTTHLKGMQVGGNEQNGGGGEIIAFYKYSPYGGSSYNSEGLKVYLADYTGQWGMASGICLCVIHPDISRVAYLSTNLKNVSYKFSMSSGDTNFSPPCFALTLNTNKNLDVQQIAIANSIDSLSNLDSSSQAYNFRNFSEVTDLYEVFFIGEKKQS